MKYASLVVGLLFGLGCLISVIGAGTSAGGEDGGARAGNVIVTELGRNWTLVTDSASWSGRYAHTSVVYDGKIWVIGGSASGSKNEVWYSAGGARWTSATLSAPWSGGFDHSSVVYDGKIWVIGGADSIDRKNKVWYSTDGDAWTSATLSTPWSNRGGPSVVHDGRMWVVGSGSGVWSSMDGATWTPATLSAPWSVDEDLFEYEELDWSNRYGYSSVVHDGKIWVIGGAFVSRLVPDSVVWKNDVWYSEDGANWTQATGSAPWSVRDGHASVAVDGKIWVIGGKRIFDGPSVAYNDVWYSMDGETWTAATRSAAWSGRGDHSAVVYDGKIWIMGGTGLVALFIRNDVWHSPPIAGASSWTRYR